MTTTEIILRIRKKIPLLLVATVVSFFAFYYVFTRLLVTFSSETSFYINENVVLAMAIGQVDAQEMNVMSTVASNKVLLLISSDELRDSIVKDFDLYKHFYINPNEQFAHESVLFRLNKHLLVRREPNSTSLLHLTVEDQDRFMAAGIANKIVERVNRMNKEILQNDLRKRATQYESVLPTLRGKAEDTRKELFSFVDSVDPSAKKQGGDFDRLPMHYRVLANDLAGKVDKSSSKYDQMLDEYYNIMGKLKTVGNDEWQCITVVKKALPDITVWRKKIIWYALAASGAALLFYICLLVYFYENEAVVKTILTTLKNGKAAGETVDTEPNS